MFLTSQAGHSNLSICTQIGARQSGDSLRVRRRRLVGPRVEQHHIRTHCNASSLSFIIGEPLRPGLISFNIQHTGPRQSQESLRLQQVPGSSWADRARRACDSSRCLAPAGQTEPGEPATAAGAWLQLGRQSQESLRLQQVPGSSWADLSLIHI